MYFKLKNKILFRRYENYGLVTDNSMFGYKFLNDNTPALEEKFVSESGAVMLNELNRIPQNIDAIVERLLTVFIGVDFDELKQDAIAFFMQLADEGYLCFGKTFDECNQCENPVVFGKSESGTQQSIALENCSKKIFKEGDFFRSLHIEIVSECNERCVHCYIPHELKDAAMDAELFYKILEEGRAMNIIHVTLSGGEPLLHKDILNFLRKCRDLDLAVNVLTNLTLLTDVMLDEMRKNPLLGVQTSLYSMNPEIHDSITKVKGSFEKTKNAVLKLIAAGIPVQISCPIMKQNKDTFQDVVDWGTEHNVPVVFDYVIFASYDHSNTNLVNRLSLEEVGQVFESQLTKEYATAYSERAKEKCVLTGDDPICSICRHYLCVSVHGDIFPCVGWQPKTIGNLKDVSLREIWESSAEVKRLRQIKRESFPKCVKCENRGYCTVCMMSNSNENADGDIFKINEFHCKVAEMMRTKVEAFLKLNK